MTNRITANTIYNMEEIDFMSIFNAFDSPILVAKPLKAENRTRDFELVFYNDTFIKQINHALADCRYYHEIKQFLSPDVPWLDLADKALNNIPVEPVSYYSELSDAWFRISMRGTKDGLLVINLDNISKEKEQDTKLIETAYHDILTGLYNRNKFNEDFSLYLDQASFCGTKIALLLIDLDNMKNINDFKGHSQGDKLLKHAAEILKQFNPKSIIPYRFGGDEFLVVINNQSSLDSIANITDTILESFFLEQIDISGGISIYPDNTESPEDLLRFTDIAMHYAKKDGKKQFKFFEPEMQRIFIQKLNMQSKMTDAIMSSDFYLEYQPQFDIKTGDLRGFEALIRWRDKDVGVIGPATFIPMAEETGLILPIGTWVLNTAFSTLKRWQTDYNFEGIISVNISPIQLKQPTFIQDIKDLLAKYELAPDKIEIEITEGIMIDNMNDAITKMNTLKEMGFRISLDDFGTGYSSLSYLRMLPLNTLKIDKSFINGITMSDGIQANITNSIIAMVSKMGLETIAEGVEKPEQLQILKDFNCHIVQGFLRGKPMSVDSCQRYLAGDKSALINLEK
ncbi:MAG: bifunctional diguanylate cyclase/phosphodiesterase [Treponema sp.]|nr:bifunctional diguanylate cyclase/phosphodiesterase [Treponema sp.]